MVDLLVAKIYCHERLLLLIGDWSGSTLNFVESKPEEKILKGSDHYNRHCLYYGGWVLIMGGGRRGAGLSF